MINRTIIMSKKTSINITIYVFYFSDQDLQYSIIHMRQVLFLSIRQKNNLDLHWQSEHMPR